MNDSKELWLRVHGSIPDDRICLGRASSAAYRTDPKMLVFMAARYKFVAKMLSGLSAVIEVGCGDAFGTPIVAAEVGHVFCTDIDEETLADNTKRLGFAKNVSFEYFDFRKSQYRRIVDGAYGVDVLEHIYPEEEAPFLSNFASSLREDGIALFGTPNATADRHASEHSRAGHVNVKDQRNLRATMERYFQRVFIFSMNDEVVHTGHYAMAHYLWAVCVGRKR